jgi:hypothetical protein
VIVWDRVQLTRFIKGYNNKVNVTFGEVMRIHEEDRRDIYYVCGICVETEMQNQ